MATYLTLNLYTTRTPAEKCSMCGQRLARRVNPEHCWTIYVAALERWITHCATHQYRSKRPPLTESEVAAVIARLIEDERTDSE